jgi:hypothetical protein
MVGVSSIFFMVAQQAVGQDQGAQPVHTAQIITAAAHASYYEAGGAACNLAL